MRPRSGARGLVAYGLVLSVTSVAVWAQGGGPAASLKAITVPKPPDLDRYARDEEALVVLGKALFWDMQLSSDNRVACASCHFHAGADHRRQNQLSSTSDPVQLNWALVAGDFPFARGLVEAGHRAGSAGMFPREFVAVGHAGAPDSGSDLDGEAFPNVHGVNLRQVTTRNAPSVINSAFTYRTFWDGRASDIFTGWTPFGDSDTRASVVVDADGRLVAVKLHIEQASLASQAVGPPLDAGEMSYRGRTWPWLGRKMVDARPLASQAVAPDDSVLGPYASTSGRGLAEEHTYRSLIHAAFRPEYWRSSSLVDEAGGAVADGSSTPGFEQVEYNFPLFFGLAIQAYESTLISDDSPYDRYLDEETEALSNVELTGLEMFQRRRCASCHVDPELTLATYSGVFGNFGFPGMGPDAGFFNNGVEPIGNDIGMGGDDPFGQPLARTVREDAGNLRFARGAFKTPTLRNVEFTGPYFHSGSKSTLEQIVDFYTSGGDYFAPALRSWRADSRERAAMPAFMKAFTDDRVRFERAPFDHPELCVSIGHVEDGTDGVAARAADPRTAAERWASIPAVGAYGNSAPLQTFEELLLEVGNDGSRAHTLTEPCGIPEIGATDR